MVTADWLEKAERLRTELTRLNSAQIDGIVDALPDREAQERVVIARWLRTEFSDEPPPDTATLALALFPHAPPR
jgi:hypothetical protein